MNLCIHSDQNFEVALRPGKVLGFESPSCVVLACVEGSVWVTAPSSDDVLLDPNQSIVIENAGRVVVQALNAARLRVTETPAVEPRRNRFALSA
jgi:hypothetical protein